MTEMNKWFWVVDLICKQQKYTQIIIYENDSNLLNLQNILQQILTYHLNNGSVALRKLVSNSCSENLSTEALALMHTSVLVSGLIFSTDSIALA